MKRLAVLFLVVAAAVALAGIFLPSDAAVVGSVAISRQALDSDLSAIAQSPDYTCFLSEERQLAGSPPVPMLGAGTPSARGGVYAITFVDDWLGSMITGRVAGAVVAHEGLTITAADLGTAKAVLDRRIAHVLSTYARATGMRAPGCGGSAAAVRSRLAAGQANADATLTHALQATALEIDPRYGSVSPGHVTLVLPPSVPPATDVPSAVANTPRLTAASA